MSGTPSPALTVLPPTGAAPFVRAQMPASRRARDPRHPVRLRGPDEPFFELVDTSRAADHGAVRRRPREGGVMTGDRAVRDAFAVHDADSLCVEVSRARASASLDPRLRPLLDDLADSLVGVRREQDLVSALAGVVPLLDVLAAWPPPRGGPQPTAAALRSPLSRRPPSWQDVRLLRFAAAFGALRALQHRPDGEEGRALAAAAIDLGRQARALAPRPGAAGPSDDPNRPASRATVRRATPGRAWRRRSRAA